MVVLALENRNASEARIFLRGDAPRKEVTRIMSESVDVVTFSWSTGVPLVVEVELVTGERYRLPPRHIRSGEQLRLIIAPDLRRSDFAR